MRYGDSESFAEDRLVDCFQQVELIWMYMILFNFAELLTT